MLVSCRCALKEWIFLSQCNREIMIYNYQLFFIIFALDKNHQTSPVENLSVQIIIKIEKYRKSFG